MAARANNFSIKMLGKFTTVCVNHTAYAYYDYDFYSHIMGIHFHHFKAYFRGVFYV